MWWKKGQTARRVRYENQRRQESLEWPESIKWGAGRKLMIDLISCPTPAAVDKAERTDVTMKPTMYLLCTYSTIRYLFPRCSPRVACGSRDMDRKNLTMDLFANSRFVTAGTRPAPTTVPTYLQASTTN
ncbi:hypothetical protein IAQ61_000165 [Plenodomus lingam]|uniref:uncharacterized protein n=1 Tax=Leptosphaeria maculans TaxID=5022 RepID=UPI00332DDCF5|nr:hypothetical protein IAQ61_000165 [Plenodomus lingam]